ncbi:flagellar export protein FliJ [Cohaesibacter celericrescens]|uniref:Flagellar FliJ protein n=1 Tax=Cohaesibacter celericrescens TaxID=2067669 RepID=A0A2N5XM91_9HYPH|nr:flagellar export protein FliJ [Cohaesibacter celericrescens]PLW75605.1 flagellar export protein FliJ [Cohaesibacter celericrescens]
MKSRESLIRLKRFQVDEKRRQVGQIELMVTEFEGMIRDLDNQIVVEEQKAGISDIGHFAYPTFAKAAMQRKDNLLVSIADLNEQLERAQDLLREAVGELKKVEKLEERDHQREQAAQEQAEQEELDEFTMIGRRRRR